MFDLLGFQCDDGLDPCEWNAPCELNAEDDEGVGLSDFCQVPLT